MFEALPMVRINKSVGLQRILNFPLLRDVFPYRWRVGFFSRREFRSLNNPRSELHHLIFAE